MDLLSFILLMYASRRDFQHLLLQRLASMVAIERGIDWEKGAWGGSAAKAATSKLRYC